MKKSITRCCLATLAALLTLPATAQLTTGYYRVSNASSNRNITIANDRLNYHTIVNGAGGATALSSNSNNNQQYAINIVGKYLENDIHLKDGQELILPGEVIYADKKNNNATNYEFNLIAQGTSLLTLTTGMYDGTNGDVEFQDLYLTIKPEGSHYTASIELKAIVTVYLLGMPITTNKSLGSRYFVDQDGIFAINQSSNGDNAKWDAHRLEHFNVVPQVEFNGKYYTTLKVPFACTLGGQVNKAYVITAINDGIVQYTEITGTIPAGTPVILECDSPNAIDCQLGLTTAAPKFTAPDPAAASEGVPTADESSDYAGTNLLKGTYYDNTDGEIPYEKFNSDAPNNPTTAYLNGDNYTKPTGPQKYVLGITEGGKLGFVPATGTAMPANTAWLESAGEFPWELPVTSLLGDVNDDGTVSIKDVTTLIDYLLSGEANPFNATNADVNSDGSISIKDVTELIDQLLSNPAADE